VIEISENAQIQRDSGKWCGKPILSVKNEWWNVDLTLRSDHKNVGSRFLGNFRVWGKMSNVTKITENGRIFKKISEISKNFKTPKTTRRGGRGGRRGRGVRGRIVEC